MYTHIRSERQREREREGERERGRERASKGGAGAQLGNPEERTARDIPFCHRQLRATLCSDPLVVVVVVVVVVLRSGAAASVSLYTISCIHTARARAHFSVCFHSKRSRRSQSRAKCIDHQPRLARRPRYTQPRRACVRVRASTYIYVYVQGSPASEESSD